MLARRELSAAQLRQRLARKGHDRAAIDAALDRLTRDRALDDGRVAGAIARTELILKKRGRLRALQKIQAVGISAALAERAVDEALQELDPGELLQAALEKRLRGRQRIADEKELARLYRYLTGQGFERERVLALLRRRLRAPADD